MLKARRDDTSPASKVIELRLPRAANDNALIDRTSEQVDAIGLAFIGLLGMFGIFLILM